jgi:hypothetical protein
LKQLKSFPPNQIANICSYYLRIGQGSPEFIKLLMTAVALNAHQLSFAASMTLLSRLIGMGEFFKNEIAILLENSLIP